MFHGILRSKKLKNVKVVCECKDASRRCTEVYGGVLEVSARSLEGIWKVYLDVSGIPKYSSRHLQTPFVTYQTSPQHLWTPP